MTKHHISFRYPRLFFAYPGRMTTPPKRHGNSIALADMMECHKVETGIAVQFATTALRNGGDIEFLIRCECEDEQ